ncbi:MAG: tRNA threonylcarbamoyladenosine biosynthesis protein TsaE [Flavobacterium sp. SCGC AAA160-P02]|nr:MAG: tRNA threonylcarbamoyladenosine biosynthesis protein TsaE [Flavobacterium sp. SCGC AAA160-P02]
MNKNYSLSDLNSIAKEIIQLSNNKTFLFYGEMGIGKTTLIKEICKILGTVDVTNSPTFSIVNEYKTTTNQTIYHFDFYRLKDEQEAYDIGIESYFYSEAWFFIEWPENIENLLPLMATEIHLTKLSDGRRNIQLKKSI